jgi:hypothetical protein
MDGEPGMDGPAGMDGVDGMDGEPGMDGMDGQDGQDGQDGMDGVDGEDGDAGAEGPQGPPGPPGPPGTSGIFDRSMLTGRFVIYPLAQQLGSGIQGNVRFAEFADGSTLVSIQVSGPNVSDSIRTAHVHYNDVATGGSPAVTLNKVDGFTSSGDGFSETIVTKVDATAANAADPSETFVAGAAITYMDFVGTGVMGSGTGFNGYVNVHWVTGDSGTGTMGSQGITAGDIGENY